MDFLISTSTQSKLRLSGSDVPITEMWYNDPASPRTGLGKKTGDICILENDEQYDKWIDVIKVKGWINVLITIGPEEGKDETDDKDLGHGRESKA